MKIVVAHESIDSVGGVETYLASIIGALQARGHGVALLYHHGGRGRLPVQPDLVLSVADHGADEAFRALRAWGAEVCFSHNMAPLDVERRALAEWPVVKMMHGHFGTCISGSKAHTFPMIQACDRAFGPGCVALYVPRRCGQLRPSKLLNGYRWATEQRALLSKYAAIVVASGYMAREYRRHGVNGDRLNVLPLFADVATEGTPCARDAVLFAGRMTSLKGGQLLIDAIARVARLLGRHVPLVMAGAGPQREEWRRMAESLSVRAEFPGWVEGTERSALFRRAAILAVPSLAPETFGLVGLEAAAFGVPAIAFDVGGVREWLRHDVTGRLVRPEQGANGLAAEIAALLQNPDRRCELGEAARETSRVMSLDAHLTGLEQVLHKASRVRGPGSGVRDPLPDD